MQFFVHLGIKTRLVSREILNAELVALEILAVKELIVSGGVSQAWKRQNCQCVVLLLEAFCERECRAVLTGLPFSKAGILDIQFIAPVDPFIEVFSDPPPD